jgi:hypothetical protein
MMAKLLAQNIYPKLGKFKNAHKMVVGAPHTAMSYLSNSGITFSV